MRGTERRLAILQVIRENGHADSSALAEQFGVSTMTVRRDLAKLEEEGLVITEYGGAVLKEGTLYEHDMYMKQLEMQAEKERIAKHCAAYVREGDAIFLDSGTTILALAQMLVHRTDITVMTHSLLVGNAFTTSNTELIMCPGAYRPKSMAYMGQLTSDFVARFHFDRLFQAVEGVDAQGVSVPDVADGATKTSLVRASDWVCCMADSSKINRAKRFHCGICEWDKIDVLVTDSGADPSKLDELRKHVEVVVV